jgi:hypothetical protein
MCLDLGRSLVIDTVKCIFFTGWMQLVILVFHMSGSSQMSKHIQVLASSYVFLNGFGHFNFFWKQSYPNQKQDKSPSTPLSANSHSEILRLLMVCKFQLKNKTNKTCSCRFPDYRKGISFLFSLDILAFYLMTDV